MPAAKPFSAVDGGLVKKQVGSRKSKAERQVKPTSKGDTAATTAGTPGAGLEHLITQPQEGLPLGPERTIPNDTSDHNLGNSC